MRKPVDGTATAVMVLLCLIWGAQQVAMKAVVGDIAPIMQVAVCSGIAAALVWLIGKLIMRELWLPGVWCRSGLVVAVLFAGEFLFVAEGLRWTSASHMAVFLYTAPLFAAIGLHLRLPEERLGAMGYLWLAEQTSFGFLLGASLTIVGLFVVNLGKAVGQTRGESYPTPKNRKEKMQL